MTATVATTVTRLFAYRPGRLATNSLYNLAGLSLRTGAQLATFILLARTLGAAGFGAYTTTVAVASLLAPLACLGTPTPLVRDVARDPHTYPARLGTALLAWLCAAPAIALCAAIFAGFLPLPISWRIVGAIVATEVLFTPLVDLIGRCCQAKDHAGAMASVLAGLIFTRLAVALGLLSVDHLTLDTYAWVQLFASALYTGAALAWVFRRYGTPHWHAGNIKHAFRSGRAFMAIGLSQRTQLEANKPILLSLAGASAAGVFASAHRVIDAATLPLIAFVTAAAPRVYRACGAHRAVLTLLPIPTLGAAGIGVAIWFVAPLLPWLLGPTYEAAVSPTRMLCALPVLVLLRMLSVTSLVASRSQRQLLLISFLAGISSALLAFWLIPLFGLAGAVHSLYLAEVVIIFAASIALRSRREMPPGQSENHNSPTRQ